VVGLRELPLPSLYGGRPAGSINTNTFKLNDMKRRNLYLKVNRKWLAAGFMLTGMILQAGIKLYAQTADGNAGINEATTKVKSYFDAGTNLMYAVGAIVGLVGAVKVYNKWNSGDQDTGKVAAAWFGSCVFLVVVATVLKSFFGI
jgi:hypothetical protein